MRTYSRLFFPAIKGLLIFSTLVLLIFACSKEEQIEDDQNPSLAQIDDYSIDTSTYKLSQEFSLAPLKKLSKEAFLDAMINEYVIANYAAEEMNMDTAEYVARNIQNIKEELITEEVFQQEVLNKIEVSEAEIKAEINKAAVKFAFRFIPAASKEEAESYLSIWGNEGYDVAVSKVKERYQEVQLQSANWQSPLIKAEDIDPDMLGLIQNLEMNTPSQPTLYNGQWYILEVNDIRREIIGDWEYQQKAPSTQKVIYNRKAVNQGAAFVEKTMAEKDVRTKKETARKLSDILYKWFKEETPNTYLTNYWEAGEFKEYKAEIATFENEIIVHFDHKDWSVADFLEHYNPTHYQLRADASKYEFYLRFIDVIALVVRDHVFAEIAADKKMTESKNYKEQLASWRQKWLFQAYVMSLQKQITTDTLALEAFYKKEAAQQNQKMIAWDKLQSHQKKQLSNLWIKKHLLKLAESERANHNIKIYKARLDSLELKNSRINPNMTIQLFKDHSLKTAFPLVDPIWAL